MRGVTLIELMLALFISTLILSALIAIYLATLSINQNQIALSAIIENSNMAVNFMSSDLRAAGKKKVQPYYSAEMKPGSMALTVCHDLTNEINSYFIAKTKRKNKLGQPIYALYQYDNKHIKTELVEGVNDMNIQYTVVDHNQLKHVSENEINNSSNVIGISIMLSLSSLNEMILNKNEYFYVAI
jgi:Tfp pilus assembly protein PilV